MSGHRVKLSELGFSARFIFPEGLFPEAEGHVGCVRIRASGRGSEASVTVVDLRTGVTYGMCANREVEVVDD
jgi:hypothetical protein